MAISLFEAVRSFTLAQAEQLVESVASHFSNQFELVDAGLEWASDMMAQIMPIFETLKPVSNEPPTPRTRAFAAARQSHSETCSRRLLRGRSLTKR